MTSRDQRPPVRLAVISDPHVGLGEAGEPALFRRRLERALEESRAAGVDGVLMPGDLTREGAAEEMAAFCAQVRRLPVPVVAVPGNHDVGNKASAGSDPVRAAAVAAFDAVVGPSYRVAHVRWLRVLALNAQILGSGSPDEALQWAFLENELRGEGGTDAIALLHYPPFVEREDEPDDPYWNVAPAPRARLLQALAGAGVRAVVSGHLHRPLHHRVGSMALFTAAPVSFGLPAGLQAVGWSLMTVPSVGQPTWEFRPLADEA